MSTNCKAFIISATDKVTGMFYGFYSKGNVFPETTACIWFAKFYMSNGKGIKNALDNLNKKYPFASTTGHELVWKIQEVTMNAPKDI